MVRPVERMGKCKLGGECPGQTIAQPIAKPTKRSWSVAPCGWLPARVLAIQANSNKLLSYFTVLRDLPEKT